ncbi:MAG: hypothetical protein DWQ07_02680 [Chloroflexi bacterium]|nr:MAG: hypothetical protein DWQ07_02680 [Chloroflexota bacterium]MBL1193595.1 hypothetical protein [Chloroflexota bacterium]NOH10886.1 hypothetical protein [Chloroflexota bacterium]
MTNILWLDWALMTVSLANTILLIWLGLTVLLNAERRTWGALLAGSGLLLGAIFFISHSAILGFGFTLTSSSVNLWWNVGWVPVVALPLVWYVLMLWYSGYWDNRQGALRKRQRIWFWVTFGAAAFLLILLATANPLPSYEQVTRLSLSSTPSIAGIPILILIYPFYIVLCILLSLDALRRPGPSQRVMGELARQRARPWLAATALVLLSVSLLVAWAMFWIISNADNPRVFFQQAHILGWFDLAIASLIGVAILLVGQAVVSYEIFTGKALPRRGLVRQWQRAIMLAVGIGALVSLSITIPFSPIYSLLMVTVIMTVFYGLLSWRSYTERERYIDNLRPFVASQGLFDQLFTPADSSNTTINMQGPFNALCGEVLGTRRAYLIALGPLAPLVGPPLCFPASAKAENLPAIHELIKDSHTPQPEAIPIDSGLYAGAAWAVPLWSERGQIGVLLLGNKRDGGLYTQEEIEIAQTSGERLIDTKASAEIAQRLMTLQRQRLAESQLLDQRARRVLHDEVLPQLHTAMLKMVSEKSKPNGSSSEAIEMLARAHGQISDLLREMPTTSLPEISKLGLIGAMRRLVEEEYGQAFEEVRWHIDPQAERQAQDVSPLTAEVLYYASREAIRNASRHARSEGRQHPLHLDIHIDWEQGLQVEIADDGVGVGNGENEENSQGGHGLALHSTMMAVVGGELAIESQPGEYTRVSLKLPHSY